MSTLKLSLGALIENDIPNGIRAVVALDLVPFRRRHQLRKAKH
jgi:hypothetical protein